MGPKTNSSNKVVRRITPISSAKKWKDDIRRSCLERIRQSKLRNNQDSEENFTSIRHMIQEELTKQQQQVHYYNNPTTQQEQVLTTTSVVVHDYSVDISMDDELMEGGTTTTTPSPSFNNNNNNDEQYEKEKFVMSEEELLQFFEELAEELEEEYEKRQEDQVEEIIENEIRYLENQVLDYEEWEEEKEQRYDDDDESSNNSNVICPICFDANLIQIINNNSSTSSIICCPNEMDGISCNMRIICQYPLHSLQEKLRKVYEDHSIHCHNYISFQINNGILFAKCTECNTSIDIT